MRIFKNVNKMGKKKLVKKRFVFKVKKLAKNL
jgi:hypothetical protein